jgi:hypothetical protein
VVQTIQGASTILPPAVVLPVDLYLALGSPGTLDLSWDNFDNNQLIIFGNNNLLTLNQNMSFKNLYYAFAGEMHTDSVHKDLYKKGYILNKLLGYGPSIGKGSGNDGIVPVVSAFDATYTNTDVCGSFNCSNIMTSLENDYDHDQMTGKNSSDPLFGKIKNQLLALPSSSPVFLNSNFLNNGALTTSSKELTANISVTDNLGITAYSVCKSVDVNGCITCSLTPPTWQNITQTNKFNIDLPIDFTSYSLIDDQILSVYVEVMDSKDNRNQSCDQITYTAPLPSSYSISGKVTLNGAGLAGVPVALTGTGPGSAITDSSGNYSFSGAANGSYTVTPSMTGYTFSPVNRTANVSGANFTVPDFIATANSAPQVSITANPTRVPVGGGNSTISWSASNVNSCIVSGPGLSSTNLSGSQEVSISTQSTYTITCQTNNSPITKSVIVNIVPIFGEF